MLRALIITGLNFFEASNVHHREYDPAAHDSLNNQETLVTKQRLKSFRASDELAEWERFQPLFFCS
jgi:hypothetical protein